TPPPAPPPGDQAGTESTGVHVMASKGDCSVILLQLQKLKRSLSFKTKSLRSKSADNFFQGTGSDGKLPADALPEITASRGSQPRFGAGSLSSTPTRGRLQPPAPGGAHAFQEHIFKKPTFCDACSHMIVACGNKVDPVYEALRFGTSLAQKTKRGSSGSASSSPNRNSPPGGWAEEEGRVARWPRGLRALRTAVCDLSSTVFAYSENGSDDARQDLKITNGPGFTKVRDEAQTSTYVALYKFVPQENEDLEMRPGDVVTLLEDSNEDWWKGKIQDRTGFFPANFVQRVQPEEKIFKCVQTFIGCKEQGQITLKENQICVASEEGRDGFIKVCSGRKKGLVPLDILENI
uniref:SH3 and cysteine rich domain n=1 Tax=Vombatus ursinus TaxID=29139 RepID=A0A4X2LIG0_VOMUR